MSTQIPKLGGTHLINSDNKEREHNTTYDYETNVYGAQSERMQNLRLTQKKKLLHILV